MKQSTSAKKIKLVKFLIGVVAGITCYIAYQLLFSN